MSALETENAQLATALSLYPKHLKMRFDDGDYEGEVDLGKPNGEGRLAYDGGAKY